MKMLNLLYKDYEEFQGSNFRALNQAQGPPTGHTHKVRPAGGWGTKQPMGSSFQALGLD